MTTVAALTHVRVRLSGPNITRATANIKQAFVVEQYSSTVEIAPLHIQIFKKTNYTRTNTTNHRNNSNYMCE